ncbi:hypothetical protein G9C85_07005 [Halorubellus sp. JP-L1]|uniref:hypothetical protein n=1 Tax=Halorubellus sp. JP-L1 TaxID=2715753 RepID=UPI00140CB15E|nr:hypothetical protein [Halorubellus sp. JP-L1]NHN41385.1 hypothetical protein [Halorubellus sp. JP-L1]
MFPLQVAFGLEAPALALLAIVAVVILVLLVRAAISIAVRVAIVAAVLFGLLYVLNVTLGFDPLGLPGVVVVDLATLTG